MEGNPIAGTGLNPLDAAGASAYQMYPSYMVYSLSGGAQAMMVQATTAKDHSFLSMLPTAMLAKTTAPPTTTGEEGREQQQPQTQPTYVNPKQYNRIMERRKARARLEAHRKYVASRKPFLHKSRHEHACRRPRGKGGRFLTKEELAAEAAAKEATAAAAAGTNTYLPPPQSMGAGNSDGSAVLMAGDGSGGGVEEHWRDAEEADEDDDDGESQAAKKSRTL